MFYKISGVVLLLIVCLVFWLHTDYQRFLSDNDIIDQTVIIEIKKGDSFNVVVQKLLNHKITINPYWFKFHAYQKKVTDKLKTGEFQLDPGMTAPAVLDTLVAGKVKQYAITFPEGWNFKEIVREIEKAPYLSHNITNSSNAEIMLKLGAEEKYPEGLFFPDTYYVEKNMTDLSLLRRAYKKMQRILDEEWKNKEKNIILETPYQALVLASIVEKETGKSNERPIIAGVFTRRLKKGMLLQSDPTIIYGMGEDYKGNIRAKDIIARTPYNTYVIKGLPPTPIAMPGQQSIHAVLHPEKGKSLYFVARGDGSHVFSNTLLEHNRAVNVFQRKKR